MALPYFDDAGHNAPELNSQQGFLFAVTDDRPSQATIQGKEPYYHGPPPQLPAHERSTTTRLDRRRWCILAFTGVFVALISGLAGGFIGQAIQKGRESSSPTTPSPTLSPTPSSTSPSDSNSTAIIPAASAPPGTVGNIVYPQTGCDFPASKARRRIANETTYSQKSYITICNSGWTEPGVKDDIIKLWTLTPSDCIEACISHNRGGVNERSCKGGSFFPSWTDRDEARKALKRPPGNCFLKNSTTGIGVNDREAAGIEVVALCMEGQCNGIGTG
ncbi:hypothetical protein DE146DRAFT_668588 [Phaeosphaeria sp. MPI-PUGE-AT-0046c]|nr:hypothetical protein DE146DRAFT_668588 [Phaeosphaeria sp. MPI-PUGE-AT-0046c]